MTQFISREDAQKKSDDQRARFLVAWKAAIALAGCEYFGDGTPSGCAMAKDKNDLRPRWENIEPAFAVMSGGQQTFLAHMLTFFNSELGGWPVAKYVAALPNPCLGAAAGKLDGARREALANLLVTYAGW